MAIFNIVADGRTGADAPSAPNPAGPAPEGTLGQDANCMFFGDDCAARGGPGVNGGSGTEGGQGGPGGHAGVLQLEVNTFDVIIALSAKGGHGGAGGRGGNGQQGGKGGRGGDGEECEFGGKGGNGGNGGVGGIGGRGGDGGNGGIITVIARDFTSDGVAPLMDVSGGGGGRAGDTGEVGQGGPAGDDGPSPGSFDPSGDCDRHPAKPGDPGGNPVPANRGNGFSGPRGVASRRLVA